jgi:diketogulonate reductase-like aldo/keto reductase
VKYVGLTHYLDQAHDELADIVAAEKPDFLQINYSATQRGAEKRVFPVAQEHGVAVLANRNFDDGALFTRVAGKPVPDWATAAGITSWAQLFLKFALSHPAVTVVIPATGKPDRQSDNLKAGLGPMLDETQRRALMDAIG